MANSQVDLTSCRGCGPENTYHYKIISTSDNVKYLNMETLPQTTGLIGGNTTYRFYFTVTEDEKPKSVVFGQTNSYGRLVETLFYKFVKIEA